MGSKNSNKNCVKQLEIMAYYFPQYHRDPRNDRMHGAGWTEWDLLRTAKPRYSGHAQPKTPAWGEFDESDPEWSAREIDLAADHGLTGFIYDWYWYDNQPFLNGALERGFLKSANRTRLKFALMWANHDWVNLFPATPDGERPLLLAGATQRASFDCLVEYLLEHYLHQDNYFKVQGAPYFSIYDLGTFIKGMGGLEAAREALEHFRARVKAAGFPDLHLNAVVWGIKVLPSEIKLESPEEVIRSLGFSSLTSYVWVHHYAPDTAGFPQGSYQEAAQHNYAVWEDYGPRFELPYHPNVSMGWDSSPRTQQDAPYAKHGYPWSAVLEGNTPEAFGKALEQAKAFIERSSMEDPVLTLNAWNEWTEGSYLLPDTVHGNAYLEQIRRVFALESSTQIRTSSAKESYDLS